jgi:hypothetical protein
MPYNIHALFHLFSDVLRFGPFDNFSAYRFENDYGKMKRHLKKKDNTPSPACQATISDRSKPDLCGPELGRPNRIH